MHIHATSYVCSSNSERYVSEGTDMFCLTVTPTLTYLHFFILLLNSMVHTFRGEINLDAEEIKETKLIQEESEMIEVRLVICCAMYCSLTDRKLILFYVSYHSSFCFISSHYPSFIICTDAQWMHLLHTSWRSAEDC